MEKPSAAKIFFDDLSRKSQPEAFATLAALVNPPTPETDCLEFKAGIIQADDLKDKWSKALSSFANTDGGVIIFGIATARTPEGIDSATGLALAPTANALKTRLDQLQPNAVNPPVLAVQTQCIIAPNTPGQGFVVALIPESNWKPHRAEFSKNHYYLRTGASSNPVTPGTLRYLFYPHAVTRIVPRIQPLIQRSAPESEHFTANFGVILQNAGTCSAHEVFVTIRNSIGNFHFNRIEWRHVDGYSATALEATRPIHPGARITLGETQFSGITCEQVDQDFRIIGGPTKAEFEFRIYGRDQAPTLATVAFNQAEIERSVEKEAVV